MLETTHIADGIPPNTQLVYSLREMAASKINVLGLISHIRTQAGEGQFPIVAYLHLAFDAPIALSKPLAAFLNDPLRFSAEISDLVKSLDEAIHSTRHIWMNRPRSS